MGDRCEEGGATRTEEGGGMVGHFQGRYPDLKTKIFGAMQRCPLPAWEPSRPLRARKALDGQARED